jgi:hypothetical protein
MPRVTKPKAAAAAAIAATPRRATRSSVREGSATLEDPIAFAPTPSRRRGRSRSVTPTQDSESSKHSSFDKSHLEHLPALVEEDEKEKASSPRILFPQPADFAPIVEASPYITPARHHQYIAASAHKPSSAIQNTHQSVEIYIDQADDSDEEDPVHAQLAAETKASGRFSPYSLPKRRTSGRVSAKRSSVIQSNALLHPSDRTAVTSPLLYSSSPLLRSSERSAAVTSPLAQVSGNAASPLQLFPHDKQLFTTPSPKPTPALSSPALSLMERLLQSDDLFDELTHGQREALLLDMRNEIMRLRKVEQDYLAASKPQSPPQPSPAQQSSPDITRTVSRPRDLRFHLSIAKPAAEALARKTAAAEAAAAAAAAEQHQAELDAAAADKSKKTTPQNKTPNAKTPESSSQLSAPVETPVASPLWGITSLFGSVKNIFTHRPILSPTKQHYEQSPQQNQQREEESEQARQQIQATPARSTQKRLEFSHQQQQSPTPKPRSPAPPATPIAEEALPLETPRTTRRLGRLPGSQRPVRRRETPLKPKDTNADRRAEQLEKVAHESAERKRLQEQADKIEQERLRLEEEQRQRDLTSIAQQKTGQKRCVRVDDLKVIPARRPGEGTGSYGILEEFFDFSDSDEEDMVEVDLKLVQFRSPPAKRIRLDDNVFQPKTPPAQPSFVSPVKQAPPPPPPPSTVTEPSAPNYSQVTQQAIEKQRLQVMQHVPKQPSRLRNVERLSTGSTIAASSPKQPMVDSFEVVQDSSSTPQLFETPPPKTYNWPAGTPMETPETWARIEKLYTPEMKAADHKFFMDGFAAAAANGY